jgi:hypothetical protein
MVKLLTGPPLQLEPAQAEQYAPHLEDFWATVAAGDGVFEFPEFPEPVRRFFRRFSAVGEPIDNQAALMLRHGRSVKTAWPVA